MPEPSPPPPQQDQGEEKVRTKRARPSAPALEDLAARLSDLYDTRVKVDLGRSKGRITVEFASLPDLERIVSQMDPTYERRHSDDEDCSRQQHPATLWAPKGQARLGLGTTSRFAAGERADLLSEFQNTPGIRT